jgi:hypothetical protein
MNYIKIYENIIYRAKNQNRIKVKGSQGYENHHIIPKSVGGLNNKGNLVLLTPKEHYICHRLLVEIYKNTPFSNKMYYAMWCMINGSGNQIRYSPSSRIYDKLRNEIIISRSIERFNNRKPVLQYNLYGVFIKRFGSVKEASIETEVNRGCIENSCRKESKTGSGFIWRYESDGFKLNVEPISNDIPGRKKGDIPWNKGLKFQLGCDGSSKKVYQYELNGKLLKDWECITIASNELNINRGGIENCSLGKSKSSGGFIWRYYKVDKIEGIEIKKSGRKKGSIPWNKGNSTLIRCIQGNKYVVQYSLFGEKIKKWDCVLIASHELQISKSGIHHCASGKKKTYNGYIWKYE